MSRLHAIKRKIAHHARKLSPRHRKSAHHEAHAPHHPHAEAHHPHRKRGFAAVRWDFIASRSISGIILFILLFLAWYVVFPYSLNQEVRASNRKLKNIETTIPEYLRPNLERAIKETENL